MFIVFIELPTALGIWSSTLPPFHQPKEPNELNKPHQYT
jgi:hypothetical protein